MLAAMPSPKPPPAGPARGGLVTVRSIAQAAGVSIGSVSSVLNNRHVERRISPATVQKIREASSRLGYLPNISARRLRRGGRAQSDVVLALVSSFEAPISLVNHFVFALRQAIAAEAAGRARLVFSVMIEMYDAGRLCDLPGILAGDHFNAAIIMNTVADDDQFLARSHLPYPVVLVNRTVPGYASVVEDESSGTRSAEILFRGRRRRLAVLHGEPLTQTTQVRVDRFMRRAVELTGRPAAEIVGPKLSEMSGYEAMRDFLARRQPLDGLYAVSDALALGAYRAIKERKLAIPRDVAVIGTGDYEIAPFFDPPLSSVGVSHAEFAQHACALLLRQLGRGAKPGERQVVPVRHVLRTSSGHG
jgi:LacI family transcriptional regulator, galactose operon repressor